MNHSTEIEIKISPNGNVILSRDKPDLNELKKSFFIYSKGILSQKDKDIISRFFSEYKDIELLWGNTNLCG